MIANRCGCSSAFWYRAPISICKHVTACAVFNCFIDSVNAVIWQRRIGNFTTSLTMKLPPHLPLVPLAILLWSLFSVEFQFLLMVSRSLPARLILFPFGCMILFISLIAEISVRGKACGWCVLLNLDNNSVEVSIPCFGLKCGTKLKVYISCSLFLFSQSFG